MIRLLLVAILLGAFLAPSFASRSHGHTSGDRNQQQSTSKPGGKK